MRLRKSILAYFTALGYWGLFMIPPIVLDVLGVIQIAKNEQFLNIPTWVWFQIAFIIALVVPFIAFHRNWVKLQGIKEGRVKELHRLILQVTHEAGRTVLLKASGCDVNEASFKYSEALQSLEIEAEIDGGEVKDAVGKYTTYVGFHVMRFIAENGKIISSNETKKKIEINEYQFIGRMADRADETIEKIKKVFER